MRSRAKPREPFPRGRRLALTAVSLILALAVAEVAARVLRLGPAPYEPARIEGEIPLLPLGGDLFVYALGSSFSYVYDLDGDTRGYFAPDGRITYTINRYGLRGPAPGQAPPMTKAPGTFRVLCLGDSFTFGQGVRYPDTYPARLESLLSAPPGCHRVEVMNAGVQAFGTRLESELLLHLLPFEPDLVILGFFLNDAMKGADTIRLYEEMHGEHPDSRAARISHLWRAVERTVRARRLQEEYFALIRNSYRSEEWTLCESRLAEMRILGEERGFRFLVVIFPVLWELDSGYPFADLHLLVSEACRRAGCVVLDLLEPFRGRPAASLWVHPTDHHLNDSGHRIAAEAIAASLNHRFSS
jgi:lysophospholipase L1-like esterase